MTKALTASTTNQPLRTLDLSPRLTALLDLALRWGALRLSLLVGVMWAGVSLLIFVLADAWFGVMHPSWPAWIGGMAVCAGLPFTLLSAGLGWQLVLALERTRRAVGELAMTDALTGLGNRYYLFHHAQRLWTQDHADAQVSPLAVLMVDVDAFKRVNDLYGHLVGDAVLTLVAAQCQAIFRPTDVLARYGGEEFVVLLPRVFTAQAMALAERLRTEVATASGPAGLLPPVTISIGVAALDTCRCATLADLIAAADRALFIAKSEGRNRIHGAHQRPASRGDPDIGAWHLPSAPL